MTPTCDHNGCNRPQWHPNPSEPHISHRCALHEIASYNADELDEWGEENAADMVRIARAQLALEGDTNRACTCGRPSLSPGPLHHRACPQRAEETRRVA